MNGGRLKVLIEAYNHGTLEERELVLNGTAVFKIKNQKPIMTFYCGDKVGKYVTNERRWIGVKEKGEKW